ncbi:MAG TPA: AMP-binding protein [Chthoniobacter sp.]|jgi:phenylacetate-CoA ligase
MNGDWIDRLGRNPHLIPPDLRKDNGSAQILSLLAERRATERLSPAELAQLQANYLLELARHAVAHSPRFSGRMATAGLTPWTLAESGGLAKLPPLTRRGLVEAGDSLFCQAVPKDHGRVGTTSTSGSTGEPVTVRRTEACLLHWQVYTLREHLWHDRDFSGRLAAVRANFTEPIVRPDWGPPTNLFLRTGPLSGMPPSSTVEELVRWLSQFDPDYFLVLPSTLAGIVAELERTGQRLPRLRTVRTVSETVSDRLREEVRRVLGVPIEDIYTSQECGVIATQCPEEGTYHVSESILLEVVDTAGRACGPGEIGRILVTDLVNYATPLVRYEIGDYAEVGGPCSCGRGLPTIRRFLGRERNLVLLPDGTRHWPLVGFHRWAEVHPIRQFQFIQLDRKTILAKMSASSRPTAEQEARLTAILQDELKYPFEIRYEWHESPLPRGPGGKFEEFLCRAE